VASDTSNIAKNNRCNRQHGVALLSVMFILTLLTVLAVYMVEADHLAIRRVENQRMVEQAAQLSMGSEQWARRVLQRDAADSKTDHLNEDWNKLGSSVKIDNADLRTVIHDHQGRFNLNNLTTRDEVWYPAFKRLLRLLELNEGIAEAVVDWIDADQNRTHADGAEDLEYQLLDPPYRTANRPMIDVGELVYIQGLGPQQLNRLLPYVTVIPDNKVTRINVNTCPPLLLQILGAEMTSADAESLATGRGETGFESIQTFLQRPELAGEANVTAEPLSTLQSDYFQIASQTRVGRLRFAMNSMIKRNSQQGSVEVIRRGRSYL
jgi:general secretion pathway protein K